jgi:recombination protein RecR
LLTLDEKKAQQLCDTILNARSKIIPCTTCFAWQEISALCLFCSNKKRNQLLICVVETWQDLIAIEKTGGYTGVYHILGGVICPLDGIGPENLTIQQLVKRVEQEKDDSQEIEIILATNQTPEGEATAAYIAKKLEHTNAKLSCLARGVPVGSSLKYMDRVTVFKALSERRPF